MKRIGYVWEEVVADANCELAVLNALRRKHKTPFLRHVKEHYQEFGQKTKQTIIDGWIPEPIREKTINEGTGSKTRNLRIPSFRDHVVHTAVAQVLEKHLAKRFYFYACGSLPKRGQTFATKAVEAHLRAKRPKYCALADVKKFYNSVKKTEVMRCLRKIFKDEKFLRLNEMILTQMGDGLAIGFTVSHWYAHLVLSFVDAEIKKNNSRVFLVRFMDNFILMCGRKRTLHKTVQKLIAEVGKFNLLIKSDWQVFPVVSRMVQFLSYRMDYDKTILRKPLMFKMARRFKRAKIHMDAHTARTVMSYRGILKHCDSYNFRKSYLYPNVSLNLCRRLISHADKKRALCGATQ